MQLRGHLLVSRHQGAKLPAEISPNKCLPTSVALSECLELIVYPEPDHDRVEDPCGRVDLVDRGLEALVGKPRGLLQRVLVVDPWPGRRDQRRCAPSTVVGS